jgi:acyl carrier protein
MGLDTVELVMEVEEHFGIALRDEDAERIRTIGDLADAILSRIVAATALTCPSIPAFYALRSTLRQSLDEPQLRIRPTSLLSEIIPISKRRRCWSAIRSLQPWRFPGLELSHKACQLRLAAQLVSMIVPLFLLPSEMWILSLAFGFLLCILVHVGMNRFRVEIPQTYQTVGDLVRSAISTVIATRKNDVTSREHVLSELLPIISKQFGVDQNKLQPQTRFNEDLGAA